MNFDSYIFDFDGTLIDTTTCHVKATQSAFKRLNLDEPTEQAILHLSLIHISEPTRPY